MSYGPPTSGAGSSHWGGYGWDYPAGGGDGDDYYPPTRGPPPTSSYYSTAPGPSYTGLYEDSDSGSQDQADIDEAMRENHALGTHYFSRAGRHVATETESTQLGVDGRPMLPGDVDRYTLRGEHRDSSPGRTPRGRESLAYRRSFAGPGWARAFGHYRGGSEDAEGRVAYEYRQPAAPGHEDDPVDDDDDAVVDQLTRRRDEWANEERDRHTVPPGWVRPVQPSSRADQEAARAAREQEAIRQAIDRSRARQANDALAGMGIYQGQGGGPSGYQLDDPSPPPDQQQQQPYQNPYHGPYQDPNQDPYRDPYYHRRY